MSTQAAKPLTHLYNQHVAVVRLRWWGCWDRCGHLPEPSVPGGVKTINSENPGDTIRISTSTLCLRAWYPRSDSRGPLAPFSNFWEFFLACAYSSKSLSCGILEIIVCGGARMAILPDSMTNTLLPQTPCAWVRQRPPVVTVCALEFLGTLIIRRS